MLTKYRILLQIEEWTPVDKKNQMIVGGLTG